MTEEKISYRLIYIMLGCFLLGVSLEYAYMDKVMQYESVTYFSYICDNKYGEGGWQTHRINYNTWVCVEKTAPQNTTVPENFTLNWSSNGIRSK